MITPSASTSSGSAPVALREKLDRRIDLLEPIIGDLEAAEAVSEAQQDATAAMPGAMPVPTRLLARGQSPAAA
ncbi:hypothetical protein [Mesorhizobium captivum]|uniref:hypothetical protein n=1 Tax=Mesorhizobium captivum TaxID=3072319 RepID=UPI002A242B24|nr:hypothetical protein [Mesorhizobium sp. VK22E]MDX8507282.1 hypothetical protein [Mesorhizobium sp. VK22E]